MKKKISSLLVMGLVLFTQMLNGIALASAESPVQNAPLVPYYIFWGWGDFDSNATLDQPKKWEGSVEITKGKLSLVKEVLITSDEVLTNSLNDPGVWDTKLITTTTLQRYFKGMIIKVLPEKGENALIFKQNGKTITIEDPTDLGLALNNANDHKVFEDDTQMGIITIQQPDNMSLQASNTLFKSKLKILEKMIGMERWLRTKFEQGALDHNALEEFRTLLGQALKGSYSETQASLISRKLMRTFFNVNHQGLKPTLAIGQIKNALRLK